jgi:outer membrane protein assembly factor BamB
METKFGVIKQIIFLLSQKKKLSIIIDNEKVIFNNSIGDITALDANKGILLWQTPTQNNLVYADTASLITSDLVLEKDSIFFLIIEMNSIQLTKIMVF